MPSNQSLHAINRRRHHRESMVCEVQLQAIDSAPSNADGGSHFCHSRDISASGARLSADQPYPVNTRVLMTIECKENGWTRITSRAASVVWAESGPSLGSCEIGIQFTEDAAKVEIDDPA
ncbi:PilZ domain-containing protein [Thiocystis violacea]|uniref:PilZ domain-containing protein n=1 Tax=Thiocystis violacea TaxID=13725 RepID=UPI0019038E0F|nr:PilZ domain-containing protein [Thiocystis violacea]MBK1718460.1 hypothetical protein [Thiocystis violacea]